MQNNEQEIVLDTDIQNNLNISDTNPNLDVNISENIPQKRLNFPKLKILIFCTCLVLLLNLGYFYWIQYSQSLIKKNKLPVATQTVTLPVSSKIAPSSSSSSQISEQKKNIIIDDGEIIYESRGQLYLFDTKKMEKTLLPIDDLVQVSQTEHNGNKYPKSITFSPSGKLLFFNYGGDILYIYNFETKEYKKVNAGINANIYSFSPSHKLAFVDTGTGAGNRGRTLIDMEGNIIAKVFGGSVDWVDDTSFIMSKGDTEIQIIDAGPYLTNDSVFFEEIRDGKIEEKILLKGDLVVDYSSFGVVGDELFYREKRFEKSFPQTFTDEEREDNQEYWGGIYENAKVSYWKLNIKTGVKTEAKEPEKPAKTVYPRVILSPFKKWKVEVKGQWPDRKIIISSVNNSDQVEIDNGNEAVWRQVDMGGY